MVGYTDRCPCCGNIRRNWILERWDSCPPPRSAREYPTFAKFTRSVSAPMAVITSILPLSAPPPSSVSSDRPISSGIKECDVASVPHPDPCPNPITPTGSVTVVAEVEAGSPMATVVEKKEVEINKDGEAMIEEKEEDEEKE